MKKPTANILLKGERLNAFSLRSEVRQGYSCLPLLFNIVPEVEASQMKTSKRNKSNSRVEWRNKILYSQRTRDNLYKNTQ